MAGYDGSSKQKRPGFYRNDPNGLKVRCKTEVSVPGQLHSEKMKIKIRPHETALGSSSAIFIDIKYECKDTCLYTVV